MQSKDELSSAAGAGPSTAQHTPGPWAVWPHQSGDIRICEADNNATQIATMGRWLDPFIPERDANARLIAAAPDLLAALEHVRGIIVEAATTGFNWADGDWAERLFASQQITKAAITRAAR